MKQTLINNTQEEWLKVLGKGMITIPKKWREELGIINGNIVKARKEGNRVVIEPTQINLAPYRTYSDKEIDEFLKEDILPKSTADKVQKSIPSS